MPRDCEDDSFNMYMIFSKYFTCVYGECIQKVKMYKASVLENLQVSYIFHACICYPRNNSAIIWNIS